MDRILMTSLGTWDTIEGRSGAHGITYPLALVRQVLLEAGCHPDRIDVLEGRSKSKGPWKVILMGALDSRHFWSVPEYLRRLDLPVWAEERGEEHPIIVIGGQSCYSPGPVLPFVDVAYVGEAEVSAGKLVQAALMGEGSREERLARAAELPGCWVPSVHGLDHEIEAVYADDASISIRAARAGGNINMRRIFRFELARGCPYRCPFCALGWRQPYRPMPIGDIIAALEDYAASSNRKEIHLQAELHPDVTEIRATVARLGLWDHSWIGRLDTVDVADVLAGEQLAFGLEGISYRLRQRAGKRGYTNEWVSGRVGELWQHGARRIILRFIGGLPGEGDEDIDELEELFWLLEDEAKGSGQRQFLHVGRQPFGPLPHTPWGREAPGLSHDRVGQVAQRYRAGKILSVVDKEGQRLLPSIYAAIPMRCGPEVAPILAAGMPRVQARYAVRQLQVVLRKYGVEDPTRPWRKWRKDEPVPWRGVKVRCG